MDTQPKRPRGQPPKPPEQLRNIKAMIRLNPAEFEAYRTLGGAKWVREQLKQARS